MTEDVRQWLAQIKALQQQLSQVQQQRDEADASAANWCRLYETEAQQRRTDAHLARQTIEQLQAQIQQLQDGATPVGNQRVISPSESDIESEVEQLETGMQLKQKLVEVLLERDLATKEVVRLQQALKVEQENHTQTRKSLTSALGDAIDRLNREREEGQK